jgi:hypothetical protein
MNIEDVEFIFNTPHQTQTNPNLIQPNLTQT